MNNCYHHTFITMQCMNTLLITLHKPTCVLYLLTCVNSFLYLLFFVFIVSVVWRDCFGQRKHTECVSIMERAKQQVTATSLV